MFYASAGPPYIVLGLTCHSDIVGRDLIRPAVHPAVPGPRVPGLQPGDRQRVAGRVQPDPAGVDEGRGAQLRGEDGHPGVLDGGERGTGPAGQLFHF